MAKMTVNDALHFFNLKRGYTEEELKQEYRKLARKYHPDASGNHDLFTRLGEAYELLSKHIGETGCKLTHTSIFKFRKA